MAALKYQVEGGDAGSTDEHVEIVPNWRLPGNRKADTFVRQKGGPLRQLATRLAGASGKRSGPVGKFRAVVVWV